MKLNKKSRAIAKALRQRREAMEAQFAKINQTSDYAEPLFAGDWSNRLKSQHGGISGAYRGDTSARAIVRDGTAPAGRFEKPKKR